jgi:hypothetical protein
MADSFISLGIEFSSEREVRRRDAARGLALSAGAHTVFLQKREDLGSALFLYPGKMFR